MANRPLAGFAVLFLLLSSRAIYWLLNPQFYIEDGPEFYGPAFNDGVGSLPRMYASYYHVVPRILSLTAASLPVRYGPLAMEVLALAVEAGAAAFLLSNRMAKYFPSSLLRFGMAFVVIGYPNTSEMFGNVAHAQWYLGILSLALVCSEPGKRLTSRIGDGLLLAANGLTGPFAPIVAGVAWSQARRQSWRMVPAVIATVTGAITVYVIILQPRAGLPSPIRFSLFNRMISNQVVFGSVRGLEYIKDVFPEAFFNWSEFVRATFAILVIVLGAMRSPPLIRGVAVLGVFTLAATLVSKTSWIALGSFGTGQRYFYYLGLAFLFAIYAFSVRSRYSISRWFFRALLISAAIAMAENWVYDPPFDNFNFGPQIAKYERARVGETVDIQLPIDRHNPNPSWTVHLRKK